MKNQMMEPADEKLVKIETVFPRSVYSSKNVSGNLKIVPDGESVGALIDWAFKE